MDKAILVIDMPDNCRNCMCYVLGQSNNFCEVTKFAIFDSATKPSHCPLKPAPEEQLIWFDDERSDWERGYNNCLREIVGK